MFYNKAQREIFNKMLEESRNVRKFAVDDGRTFISANGFVGYVFPNCILKIDISKLQDFHPIDLQSIVDDKNKLEATSDFVMADERSKKMARRYKKNKTSVFIDTKLLVNFQNPTLYIKDEPNGYIIVTEFTKMGKEEIVGLVMPLRNVWSGHYSDEL